MADAARAREDYTHPEKHCKNLRFFPEGITEEVSKSGAHKDLIFGGDREVDHQTELCWSCGWNVGHEWFADYVSRVRIFRTRNSSGIWEVGSRWMIKDQPNDSSVGNDHVTQEFLRNHQPKLDIPLLKEMRILSEPTDKVRLTLMSRAQGVPLSEIWSSLTRDEVVDYKNQLGRAMKEWRQFKSPVPQTVDGRPLDDCLVGVCESFRPPMCKKIGRTNDEWLNDLEKEFRIGLAMDSDKDSSEIEAELQELKKNFPKSEPYVLTHGDLNLTNIMVKDGKIEAIIDWEWSGYMPWWAERWLMALRHTNDFMDLLWEDEELMKHPDIGCGMDNDTFIAMISRDVSPAIGAFAGSRDTDSLEHPKSKAIWMRPGFCKCQPYAGIFKMCNLGLQVEHIVKED